MSTKVIRDRARAKRARFIRFDTVGARVTAYVCDLGHRHPTFIKALECAGRRK